MATDKITIEVDLEAQRAISQQKQLNQGFDRQERSVGKLRIGYAALAAGLAAVGLGLTRATKSAIDFEEANSKFLTTFRDVQTEANRVRQNLVRNFGLSTKAATELLGTTGDLLSGFGFTGKAALDLSEQVNTLAADLASFSNVPVTQASQAITKALIGERESLKTLGVAILETDVQQRLLEKGQQDLTGTALRQAKAQATLELAVQQSQNAIGDFARTSNSTANQIKQITAVSEDLVLVFGSIVKDAIAPAILEFGNFIKSADGLKTLDAIAKGFAITISVIGAVTKVVFNSIRTQIENITLGFRTAAQAAIQLANGEFKAAFETVSTNALQAADNTKRFFVNSADAIKQAAGEIADAYENANARIIDDGEATTKELQNQNDERVAEEESLASRLADIYKKDREKFNEENERKRAIIDQTFESIGTIISGTFDFIAQKRQQDLDAEIFAQEQKTEKQLEELERQKEADILAAESAGLNAQELANRKEQIERDFEQAKENIQKNGDTVTKNLQKEAFEREKKLKIIQIQIAGALAVIQAFAQLGPIGGAIAAVGIGIATGVQTALVASQEFPAFQEGTNDAPRGLALVGEAGPELVNFGGGEQVVPNDILRNITTNNTTNADNRNINIVVEANDPIRFVNELKSEYGIDVFEREAV